MLERQKSYVFQHINRLNRASKETPLNQFVIMDSSSQSSSGLSLLSSSGLTGRSRKNANAYDHLDSLVKPGNDRIAAFEALTHLQISNNIQS